MTPDITLTDATDEEVASALTQATKSPINLRYFWNVEIGGRVRKFQFDKEGIELPLRHSENLKDLALSEVDYLNQSKRRMLRRTQEILAA